MTSFDPVDIGYYRYDTTEVHNFSHHWLYTGVASSCATPVIADFDNDGYNELYAGGLSPTEGSAFLYKPTGFGSGYVTWRDTNSFYFGPNESVFGIVDYLPSAFSIVNFWDGGHSQGQLILFSFGDLQPSGVWTSDTLDSITHHNPYILDMDFDGKADITLATVKFGSAPNYMSVWEQTSAGIHDFPGNPTPSSFELYQNFPNPFNSTTKIKFALEKTQKVEISIYDLTGRRVVDLVNDIYQVGEHTVEWNAGALSSGIYLISLESDGLKQRRKAVLLK